MLVCVCLSLLFSQVEEAEVLVASTAGESVDNRTRVDVVQQQEILIREEEREKMERDREKLGKEMEVSGFNTQQTLLMIMMTIITCFQNEEGVCMNLYIV